MNQHGEPRDLAPSAARDWGSAELAILVAVAILLFAGIGRYGGLWEPHETDIADSARAVLHVGASATLPRQPVLPIILVASSFRLFGVGDAAARIPFAFLSLLLLLTVWWSARRLFGRLAALSSVVILVSSAGFLFGGRQAISLVPGALGSMLLFAGLAPSAVSLPAGRNRLVDWLGVLLGAAISILSVGVLVGVFPALAAAGVTRWLLGRDRRAVVLIVGAAAVLGLAIVALLHGGPWWAIAGEIGSAHPVPLTETLRRAAYSVFPWTALVPLAVAGVVRDVRAGESSRHRGEVLGVMFLLFAWIASVIQGLVSADAPLPVSGIVALLVGDYLDRLLVDRESRTSSIGALCASIGVVLIGYDLVASPERYVGLNTAHGVVYWPPSLSAMTDVLFALVGCCAATIGLALSIQSLATSDRGRKAVSWMWSAAAVAALAFALVGAYWVIPAVSQHLSSRAQYQTASDAPSAPIAIYRAAPSGAPYYWPGSPPIALDSAKAAMEFLSRPERVWMLVAPASLGEIEQASELAAVDYFVADDRNSQAFMISNRLSAGQKDHNPIRPFITRQAPRPSHEVKANFDDKVELLGYDAPQTIGPSAGFDITLYFKVVAPMPTWHAIFVHLQGPGTLHYVDDHTPVGNLFLTQYWVPGTYIIDKHHVSSSAGSYEAGDYELLMGLFDYDDRTKIISGPQDEQRRVRLGRLRVVNSSR